MYLGSFKSDECWFRKGCVIWALKVPPQGGGVLFGGFTCQKVLFRMGYVILALSNNTSVESYGVVIFVHLK